jgi:fatty-acyl-CoA synthase
MQLEIGRWISWWASVAPDRPAIVFEGESIPYGELEARVEQLAAALRARGVVTGDRVAVLLSNRPEFVVAMFACARAGALLVPLNVRLVARELGYILGDAEPRVLISESAFAGLLGKLEDRLAGIDAVVTLEEGGVGEPYERFLGSVQSARSGTAQASEDLVICYTSGTTGLPKGAVLTHEAVLLGSLQEIVAYDMRHDDRHLVAVPLCFTGGLITASMPVFHSGGTLYLERAFDPAAVIERIASERITRMMGVPTMFAAIANESRFDDADISSMRLFLVGAAPVPAALVERFQSRGAAGFTNAYGLTEGCGFNLFLPATEVLRKPGGYKPALYTEALVIDADGRAVAPGRSGELVLRGPTLMNRYWRNEEATAEALRDGWLHTGDLVRLGEDGLFYPIDRIKDMIISGGLNVYPAEVEAVVFGHPKLTDFAVIGLPHERWGEAVTLVAVARSGEHATSEELIQHCAGRLADYKLPKRVIWVDEIPRNAGGKALKRLLRDRYADKYSVATE